MASISAQKAVADYHREISESGHHGGHNMYVFHRDWHAQNRDPVPPAAPDRNWGMTLVFGANFLQMHHEMVKAADDEPKSQMMHLSLVSWYHQKGYSLPPEWNPSAKIPPVLAYEPDVTVFPDEIRNAVEDAAHRQGVPVELYLRRTSEKPGFILPKYFSREGVGSGENAEPLTGARTLADFQNINQLGCCLVFPHNEWHGSIGGAMRSTWTAIADPIFYFGVHWHIDKVFDEYKLIQAERSIRRFDRMALMATSALPTEKIKLAKQFTAAEQDFRERAVALSSSLRQIPGHVPAADAKPATVWPVRRRSSDVTGKLSLSASAPKKARETVKASRSIQMLMDVPAPQHDLAWLKESLQRAIELELFTIPPYLCAMWSLKKQDGPVRDLLQGIAIEEMFHFGLACNMLNSIGGSPQINTRSAVPKYPGSRRY